MTTAILKLQKRVQGRIDSVELPSVNWKALLFMSFFMMSIFLVLYALQVNNLMNGSYLVNIYEKQIDKLSKENRALQVSFAENDFMGQTLEKAQKLNLEKTTLVKYVQILDNSFAVAK